MMVVWNIRAKSSIADGKEDLLNSTALAGSRKRRRLEKERRAYKW